MPKVKIHSNNENIRKQSNQRTVYKSVLESPLTIKWPRIPPEISDKIMDNLLKVLGPVGEYKKGVRLQTASSKKASKASKASKTSVTLPPPPPPACPQNIPCIISEHRLLIGINDVTRHLERLIQYRKQMINVEPSKTAHEKDAILTPVIFVCRRDIKPLQLCSHLLPTAALANIKLIQLPANAELLLSQTLQIQRVSALFLEVSDAELEEPLRLAVNEAPFVEAPWLTQNQNTVPYVNTRIKVLQTIGTFTLKEQK